MDADHLETTNDAQEALLRGLTDVLADLTYCHAMLKILTDADGPQDIRISSGISTAERSLLTAATAITKHPEANSLTVHSRSRRKDLADAANALVTDLDHLDRAFAAVFASYRHLQYASFGRLSDQRRLFTARLLVAQAQALCGSPPSDHANVPLEVSS